jgi:chorismate mutase/prephenate dehydratase
MDAGLAELRAELDRIDDALHGLILRRAAVVQQVAALKSEAGSSGQLRPGREAAILRRLLLRHDGALPPATLLRVWRELLAGTVALQGAFVVGVCGGDLVATAREQFGALTPLRLLDAPSVALDRVRRGEVAVAVLTLPGAAEPEPWWPLLLRGAPRLHVVARLPFWGPRPDGAPTAQALVVAAAAPDASGDDRSLLAVTPTLRLVADLRDAGFEAGTPIIEPDGGVALVDVAGFVTETDPRLAGLSAGSAAPIVLGGYACPIEREASP